MNILKRYSNKIAKVVFGSKITKSTLENKAYIAYSFIVDKELGDNLSPGDYVAVECAKGLCIGMFIEFSDSKYDMKLATKPVICKIGNYNVDTKF